MSSKNKISADYFGRDTSSLTRKKLFCLDMDGTVYNEDSIFEGTLDFLEKIVRRGGKYVFITNNSSKSVMDYVKKVNKMGIPGDKGIFFTSVDATASVLLQKYPGSLVYCQGTKSMLLQLMEYGIKVTEDVDDRAEVVLVGFDTELTSQKLRNTCEMLLKGTPFYATNPDLVCPVSFGYVPDCGSICGMLKNATGRTPQYIGKPSPDMLYRVMNRFSREKEETLVVGDRLYTDIACGVNAGVDTVCVLSGEADLERISKSSVKPDYVFESVKELALVL